GMRSSKQQRPSQRQGSRRGEPARGRQDPASSQPKRNKSSQSGEWDDRSHAANDGGWSDNRWDNRRWQSWDDADGAEDERWSDAGPGARANPKRRGIYEGDEVDPRRSAPRRSSRGESGQQAGAWRRLTSGFAARGQRRHAGAPRYATGDYSEAGHAEE